VSATPARRPGQHGASPFSGRTRRRVLGALRDKALAGDPAAADVLLRLGEKVAFDRAISLQPRSDAE
jgi:hypothetical protein